MAKKRINRRPEIETRPILTPKIMVFNEVAQTAVRVSPSVFESYNGEEAWLMLNEACKSLYGAYLKLATRTLRFY